MRKINFKIIINIFIVSIIYWLIYYFFINALLLFLILYLILLILILISLGIGYKFVTNKYIDNIDRINSSKNDIKYDNGVYIVTSKKDKFKILQITDIHLGGTILTYKRDIKALNTIYKLVNYSKPHLIIVTGDIVSPITTTSISFNNITPIKQFSKFMRNINIPWAFTYGNHDTENISIASIKDIDNFFLSDDNILYPNIKPNIYGRCNQLIEIRNKDNSLNQALFLIDSNSYMNGITKYDYIHDDQVKWYENEILRLNKKENKLVSSLVFFHIPLQQYRIAYDLYEKNSNKVKYFFGFNDEKLINKVCASEHPSKLFDTALKLKSTKGFFCGHDHYNNMSLEYKGVRLTYGMSIDYLAMPGINKNIKQRGATLIALNKNSTFDIKQIPYIEIEKES